MPAAESAPDNVFYLNVLFTAKHMDFPPFPGFFFQFIVSKRVTSCLYRKFNSLANPSYVPL